VTFGVAAFMFGSPVGIASSLVGALGTITLNKYLDARIKAAQTAREEAIAMGREKLHESRHNGDIFSLVDFSSTPLLPE
jgi:hypothetical protein